MARLRVLIVDDERTLAFALSRSLPGTWAITAETDGNRALELILKQEWDVVVLDLMIPHKTGMEIFEELSEKKPELVSRVVFMTGGLYIPAIQVFAATVPNHIILEKPFLARDLAEVILKITSRPRSNGSTPDA